MNTINATSCCCNQTPVGPCAPDDTYGPLTICLTDNAGSEWKYEIKWTGACDCAISFDADCPNVPAVPPSYVEGCSVTYDYYPCDCPMSAAICRREILTQLRKREGCYALPFVTQGQYSGGGSYITPAGQPTTLPATTAGIMIEWGIPPEQRFSWDKQTYGECNQCQGEYLIQEDAFEGAMPHRVRFHGPPYITIGPPVWTIRRQTSGSVANRWEITATQFIIRNSAGTVVYSIALAGQTIGSLFTAIDTQTAAPVVLLKQYQSIGTYNADLLPATTLEPRALSVAFSGVTTQMVRAFNLATGETRKMPFPTVVPAPATSASNLPNPWGNMSWQFYVRSVGQDFVSNLVTFALFAEDIGAYSEDTEAAFCSGFAESWDWDWIDSRYIFNCSQSPGPGESWAGSPQISTPSRTMGSDCLGCPIGVEFPPCTPYQGYAGGLSPLKRYFALNTEDSIRVTDEDLCSAIYGSLKEAWGCDPFESEADCCCPNVLGDPCSVAFRQFSACFAGTSSYGEWSEYLFKVSR